MLYNIRLYHIVYKPINNVLQKAIQEKSYITNTLKYISTPPPAPPRKNNKPE